MAAVAAQKNLQGEREKRKRRDERNRKEEKEKRERGEKGKKGRDQERKMYYAYMGVKHPLRTVKRLLKTRKEELRGGLKKAKKAGREEEETGKAGEKMVTSTEDSSD